MESLQTMSQWKAKGIAYDHVRNMSSVVDVSTPYLKNEKGRDVYKAPLVVKSGDRTIDMVGLAEITIDPHSGKILESLTQEEIDSRVRDLLSRKSSFV